MCGMNVTSTTAVSYSVATSSSESLPNDGEKHDGEKHDGEKHDGKKPNQPKRLLLLPKCNYGCKTNSMKRTCSLALSKVIFINLYRKDDHSGTGKAGGFFKHKCT